MSSIDEEIQAAEKRLKLAQLQLEYEATQKQLEALHKSKKVCGLLIESLYLWLFLNFFCVQLHFIRDAGRLSPRKAEARR